MFHPKDMVTWSCLHICPRFHWDLNWSADLYIMKPLLLQWHVQSISLVWLLTFLDSNHACTCLPGQLSCSNPRPWSPEAVRKSVPRGRGGQWKDHNVLLNTTYNILCIQQLILRTKEDVAKVSALWTKATSIISIGTDKADGVGIFFKSHIEVIKYREPGRIFLIDCFFRILSWELLTCIPHPTTQLK